MLHLLQRHPIAVKAHFQFSLVLAYAFPKDVLEPLLPPGLVLDTFGDCGFVAIALVQTRGLHPVFLPRLCGQDFFLSGYRVFVRHHDPTTGRHLRGLRILRSDTNRRPMAFFGNRLTHYNYQLARIEWERSGDKLDIDIRTPEAEADLHVRADLSSRPAPLPPESIFPDLKAARRYAGPLPFTFDYERQTHSIIKIEGVRENWNPQSIHVDVAEATFFERPPFDDMPRPRLANAFYLEDVDYRWKRGERARLTRN